VVLPERQATICPPRAAQTMRARPMPSIGYRQFASQAVEKTAASLVSSLCEPKPVSTARERYSPDRALTPAQKAPSCLAGYMSKLHFGMSDQCPLYPKADIVGRQLDTRFVPIADIAFLLARRGQIERHYDQYKIRIWSILLLGLEVLVAADIVKTIAIQLNFTSLGLLAGLVLVRTFLSWALVLEIKGR
jgi:hypothetical protein